MTELSIPELALVVLIGSTGSGKSTFARKHFRPTAVVSSDACRGVVSDDENDQSATPEAFALLHHIAGVRLRRGLRTVVDATNVQPKARQDLVAVARAHDVLPVAIVLDVADDVCFARNAARAERAHLPRHVVSRQQRELRRGLRGLEREGFRKVYVLRGVDEVESARIVDEKAWNDKRELTGPFDVIGDVHGCRAELETLLGELGYRLSRDESGRAIGAGHPMGRTAVFVGDLVDRGPDTPGVLRLVMGMVAAGTGLCVTGNHEHKLVRALDGKKVRVAHGLSESLAQLANQDEDFRKAAHEFCRGLISHYVLDGGRLVVAHAGLKEQYHGRASGRVRAFAMYGETTGETDEYGLPVRYPWADDYRGRATVLYGHTPVLDLRWVNNTLCLDTGVVFGGRLSALRYPERDAISVAAEQVWYEPARPLQPLGGRAVTHATVVADAPTVGVVRRDPGVLDLDDVLGRRVVTTRHHGRVGVRAENAGAALEIMSRFAVDPRWLVYLPPTMAPCATTQLDSYLEHPAEAFAYYRSEGVRRVVCEEKHMGSRAVVLVARSAAAARNRFGVDDGGTGVVYTRTGRPFFDDTAQTETLLGRVRTAAETAGLFDELNTDWLLLDTELMPWSAKAIGLLRNQYAAVGAAARASLGTATDLLDAAAARGLDVADLTTRTAARKTDADAFTAAYGRYCWPVDGLAGLRLAPFQILAGEGINYAVRDHDWHLSHIDRLAAADPELFATTGRMFVDLGQPADEAAAIAWWTELTMAGGEGMVVKPLDALVRTGASNQNPKAGEPSAGPDATGLDTTGHGAIGHGATGHGATGHGAIGHETTEGDRTGRGATGLDTTGLDTTERGATGLDMTERRATGLDTTERDTTGLDTTERRATGLDTTERDTTAHGATEREAPSLNVMPIVNMNQDPATGTIDHDPANATSERGRLIQPAVKCRGPEYLRIIYGPEYLRDNNLQRLRVRGLGRKRSMALREYALGLEALDRFVSGEPLWRVHEAVFAVLALESEPVDPRL